MDAIKVYDIKSAAALLNISVYTIRRRIYDGAITAEKIKGKYYISETAIKQFIGDYERDIIPKISDPPTKLIKIADVAEMLQTTPRTVRRWIDAGKIRAVKPGGRLFIPENELKRFIGGEFIPTARYIVNQTPTAPDE